jgi:hypothetical protein
MLNKIEMKKNKPINKLIRETPLGVRLLVSNEMLLSDLLKKLDCGECPKKDKTNKKIDDLIKRHTESQIDILTEWENDGCP